MTKIEKYEKFFECNLKIKKILHECIFDEKYSYNKETVLQFSELLEDKIEEIEYYLDSITNLFYGGIDNDLKNLINICKQKLIDCGSDHIKIKNFIEKYITDMREELVDEVGTNCFGYGGMGVSLGKAQTLNEALHIIHTTIVNNENKYEGIPKLKEKINEANYEISLYGRDNLIAENIFENIPLNLDLGITDILSLNNKILVMARDRGHALSIEITIEDEKSFIEYYIPKICNIEMVNNLKGVNKVDKQSRYTVGRYETNTNELSLEIVDFISKVPTDMDMFKEGGLFYQEETHKIK